MTYLLTGLSLLSLWSVTVESRGVDPQVLLIDQYCDQNHTYLDLPLAKTNDYLIQMSSGSSNQGGNYNCTMSLVTKDLDSQELRAKFIFFTASDKRDTSCSQGAIQITDSQGRKVRPTYCENDTPVATYNLGKRGTINVWNLNWTSGDLITFSLLVTPVSVKTAMTSCPADYFDCREETQTCVYNSLTCNQYMDCDDGRDERDCGDSGISDVAVAFIVITILFVGAVIFAAVVMRRAGRRGGFRQLDGPSETTRVLNS